MKTKFILLFVFLLMCNISKSQITNDKFVGPFLAVKKITKAGSIYQLQLNGVNVGNPVVGNGSTIRFGVFKAGGTFTVLEDNVKLPRIANVDFYSGYNTIEDISIKQGETYKTYTTTGKYTRILWSDKNKCDSTVVTNLIVTQ